MSIEPAKRKTASLKIECLPLSKLLPHPRNPRVHPEKGTPAWEALRKSLEADYWDPVVWNKRNGTLVSGHLRVKVLKDLGFTEADCVVVDYDETTHLLRMIAANKLTGQDDVPSLQSLLSELEAGGMADMDLTGYAEGEIKELMAQFNQGDPVDADPQIDRGAEINKTWKVKTGDLWAIGGHWLLCGDSTKAADVARLLEDRKPLLMVTDPPYGVEYDTGWRSEAMPTKNDEGRRTTKDGRAKGAVSNDDRADWREAWALFPGDVAYVWHAGNMAHVVAESLIACDLQIRSQIIWAKNQLVIGRGDYHPQHEPCWYCVRKGKPGLRTDDRKQTTLWQIDKPHKSETGHSTQKPIECMARPMRNHDAPEVYDPFLGSGTSLVAAQNLGRKCYGLEIAPNYCAVILQRMTDAFPKIKIERLT